MSRIVVCLDCPNYRKGGWCVLKNQSVGALNTACDDAGKDKAALIAERHDILTKTCSHCHRELPVEHFSLNKTTPDGRQSVCKECQKELYKAWEERRKAKKTMETKESEAVADFKAWQKEESNKVISEQQTNEHMETATPQTKVCPRCQRELPYDAFGKHARTKDGLQPYCRQCRSEARQGTTSRPGQETQTSFIRKAEQPKRIAVRETLTDEQMVAALRAHGWEVTCKRTITEEL